MQELSTELWLVPRGAAPPPKSKFKPDTEVEGKYAEYREIIEIPTPPESIPDPTQTDGDFQHSVAAQELHLDEGEQRPGDLG